MSIDTELSLNREQMACLLSRRRADTMRVLAQSGPSSAAELAEHLEMPEKSVYYHLRALEKVGLILAIGKRAGVKKPQIVYQVVSRRLRVDTPAGEGAAEFAHKQFRTLLRRLENLHGKAVPLESESAAIVIQTTEVRLSKEDVAEFRTRMKSLASWAHEKKKDEGMKFSYTAVLLPLGD